METAPAVPQLAVDYAPGAKRVYWMNRMRRKLDDGSEILLQPEPEVLAVAIAKCSRTDTRFDQNVYETTLAKAASFHEKYVVGFGHGSVAEHAFSSVALENISQVAIKVIEDCRLASFTEKSSRYQIFSAERSYFPAAIRASSLAEAYADLLRDLYAVYFRALDLLVPFMQARHPRKETQTEGVYKQIIKAHSCDVARYLLPSAALAQFGVTMNAREWAYAIVKLLSSPHEEARELGNDLIRELHGGPEMDDDTALRERPLRTLLKYTERNEYMACLPGMMEELAAEVLRDAKPAKPVATPEKRVVMLRDDELAEIRIASALLAKHSHAPLADFFQAFEKGASRVSATDVIARALEKRGAHDRLPREFEHAQFMHEIIIDYGAWRDIQRHRMCTPLNQVLDVSLGYDLPPEMAEIGLEREYREVMGHCADVHAALCRHGLATEAEYVVPMGYRRRIILSWNLRELFHFIELRSGDKGHPSYRHIAQEVWRTLDATHPDLARHFRVDLSSVSCSTLGAKPKGI